MSFSHEGQGAFKLASYVFMTDKNVVLLLFSADSSVFDKNVGEFMESLHSLKVDKPASLKETFAVLYHLVDNLHQVQANGTIVDLNLSSNAKISNVNFDEEQKRLSFRMEGGGNETSSMTSVSVDKLLAGPYVVTLDGQELTDGIVIDDGDNGTIQLQAPNTGAHEITITGTNVVPEFPFAMLALTAGMASLIIIFGRIQTK